MFGRFNWDVSGVRMVEAFLQQCIVAEPLLQLVFLWYPNSKCSTISLYREWIFKILRHKRVQYFTAATNLKDFDILKLHSEYCYRGNYVREKTIDKNLNIQVYSIKRTMKKTLNLFCHLPVLIIVFWLTQIIFHNVQWIDSIKTTTPNCFKANHIMVIKSSNIKFWTNPPFGSSWGNTPGKQTGYRSKAIP